MSSSAAKPGCSLPRSYQNMSHAIKVETTMNMIGFSLEAQGLGRSRSLGCSHTGHGMGKSSAERSDAMLQGQNGSRRSPLNHQPEDLLGLSPN